jgi:hypothetical protein
MGIDSATFRFVAQCLNQLRHRVPLKSISTFLKSENRTWTVDMTPLTVPFQQGFSGVRRYVTKHDVKATPCGCDIALILCTRGVDTAVLTLSVTWVDSTTWRDVLYNVANN